MKNVLNRAKITERILALQDKEQTKAYTYVILSLLTVSFFGLFALRPAFSIIANLQKQLADEKVVYEALQKKLQDLQSLDKQYLTIEPDLDLIYSAIPTSPQAASLIRQIEKVAQQNNIEINSLDTAIIEDYPIVSDDKLQSFAFTLDVEGTEESIGELLTQLTTFNRVVSIEKVGNAKGENGVIHTVIEARAYFMPNNN